MNSSDHYAELVEKELNLAEAAPGKFERYNLKRASVYATLAVAATTQELTATLRSKQCS